MYKKKQEELKRRSNLGYFYKNLGTLKTKETGLIGTENEILKSLFDKKDNPILVDKLTNMQKHVLRKMGWNKHIFIKNSKLNLKIKKQ